jgi:hypothetical protein
MPSSFKEAARNLMGFPLIKVETAKGVCNEEECCVIEGVVSPGPQSGRGLDVHLFTLTDWRFSGEPFPGRELTLLRRVLPSPDGRSFDSKHFEAFPEYLIQRFSVLLSEDHRHAIVEKALAADLQDKTLRQLSERLQVPVVVSTNRFGDVVLNRKLNWFEGKTTWNGHEVILHLDPDEDGGVAGALTTAESLWDDQAGWKRKVEQFAVDHLLEKKNDGWLAEDEQEFSPATFKGAMKLQSIHVYGGGGIEFWDDGSLFGNHAIHIHGSLKDGLTGVDVYGPDIHWCAPRNVEE